MKWTSKWESNGPHFIWNQKVPSWSPGVWSADAAIEVTSIEPPDSFTFIYLLSIMTLHQLFACFCFGFFRHLNKNYSTLNGRNHFCEEIIHLVLWLYTLTLVRVYEVYWSQTPGGDEVVLSSPLKEPSCLPSSFVKYSKKSNQSKSHILMQKIKK